MCRKLSQKKVFPKQSMRMYSKFTSHQNKQWAFNFTSVPTQVIAKSRGDARAHAGMAPLSAVANAKLLQFLRSARGIQTCTLFVVTHQFDLNK